MRKTLAVLSMFVVLGFGRAAAGTTGTITGLVLDIQTRQPIAGASVTATSPSQTATVTTDAAGKYVFISLAPDTYTINVSKTGYEPVSNPGISVFADQTQVFQVVLRPSLKTIARVHTTSGLSPVKPGTTTDVYSVNPSLTQAAAPLGGGGGLNSAYSAIAAMPGAYVPPGDFGVNQTVYIRGGFYDQIGYEYDGVPVNRSFDNYPSYSASTLGQQELEIYAGGGPASSDAVGLAGFINQVIKTGTYPGYASLSGSVGYPAFYHDLALEVGGATPDRNFSYYVGLSGINQYFRYYNQLNGANLINEFPITYADDITTGLPFWPAVYPMCNNAMPNNFYNNPAVNSGQLNSDPGCYDQLNPALDSYSGINDREAVVNLHFGIPHRSGNGRDDVQLLYDNSATLTHFYSSLGDIGPIATTLADLGYTQPAQWPDFYTYPRNTPFLASATTPVIGYRYSGSPTDVCLNQTGAGYDNSGNEILLPIPGTCPLGTYALLPPTAYDGRWDSASIAKIQYQHNMGENAYLRAFGYTFYSNTDEHGPIQDALYGANLGGEVADYEVDSHAFGGELQFADQITDTNQINATLNYVESHALRYYGFDDFNTGSFQVSSLTNGKQCFAAYTGTLANGVDSVTAGQPAPCNDPITQGTFDYPTSANDAGNLENQNCSQNASNPGGSIPAGACSAGASWLLTFTGNQGEINQVTPKFTSFSLTDEWRPNDKLDVTGSVREDRDEFDPLLVANPGHNFWYAAARAEFCYNPMTLQPAIVPEPAQFLGNVLPYVSFNCPVVNGVQTVHPDGKNGHLYLSDTVPSSYVQSYFTPNVGITYSVNGDTVLRFSAGRYAQAPQDYEIEYDTIEPNLAAQLIGFLPFGYTTPFHAAKAQFSDNYDFSYEHQFPGTDMAIKVTPYFRWATDQLYEYVSIPTLFGLSPSFNSGTESNYGIEVELTKGDFAKNGFAGVLSYTYTNSYEKWSNYAGTNINPVDPYNEDIQNYNALTKAGGGLPCYAGYGFPVTDGGACGSVNTDGSINQISNPYYNQPKQPLLNKFGWYPSGLDFPYVSPNVFALVLNYRHDRFAITPAIQFDEGAAYGTPADVAGYDPRTCSATQAAQGIPDAPSLYAADYTSCGSAAVGANGTNPGTLYIPNPYTKTFDTFGQFRQPWQFNMGLELSYDFSSRVTGMLTFANLVNRCFGGSNEPWTKEYPPNSAVCGYGYNKFFISNYFDGSSPNDVKANGVPLNPYFDAMYAPSYGDVNTANTPIAFQIYGEIKIKI